MMPAVVAVPVEVKSLEELAADYFEVCRCWNDHARAVRRRMTTSKAIHILREVSEQTRGRKNGIQLHAKAAKLLHAVIYLQDEIPEETE